MLLLTKKSKILKRKKLDKILKNSKIHLTKNSKIQKKFLIMIIIAFRR
jgi:hypothetical protein